MRAAVHAATPGASGGGSGTRGRGPCESRPHRTRSWVDQDDPLSAYHLARILGSDAARSRESAYAYPTADSAVVDPDDRFAPAPFADDFDPAPARVQAHYSISSHFSHPTMSWSTPTG